MNAYIVRTAKDKKEIKRFSTLEDAFAAIERYEEMNYDPRDPERCIEGYNDLKKMEG